MQDLITLDHYWTGPGRIRRDEVYHLDLTTDIIRNANTWVDVVNALANDLAIVGITTRIHPLTGTPLSSGWRPPQVNAITPNAAKKSLHMWGLAGDLYDPDGEIDDYLLANQSLLVKHGVWMEHPSSTPLWSHLQVKPQPSYARTGLRYFYV